MHGSPKNTPKSSNIHETSLKNVFLFYGDGKAAKINEVEEDTTLSFSGCSHLSDKLNQLSFDAKLDENALVAAELAIEIGTRMCESEKSMMASSWSVVLVTLTEIWMWIRTIWSDATTINILEQQHTRESKSFCFCFSSLYILL